MLIERVPTVAFGLTVLATTCAAVGAGEASAGGAPPSACAGHATSKLLVHGNLPRGSYISSWDPRDPVATSAMSIDVTLYVADGYPIVSSIHFVNEGGFFTYHVLAGSAHTELGSGALYFDAAGALQYEKELQPLRLVGPDGLEAPLHHLFGTPASRGGSGLDGMTSVPNTWSEIRAIEHDGSARLVGYSCSDGRDDEDIGKATLEAAPLALIACPGRATTRVAIRANLSADAPIVGVPSGPVELEASAGFATSFMATDDAHTLGAFDVFFTRLAELEWEYRVLLQGEEARPEVAHGTLAFHADGTLNHVDVAQPFRFPDPSGAPGVPIALDFGTPTFDGGTGANGVTAFRMASFLRSVEPDGIPPSVDSVCPTNPAPPPYLDFPAPLDAGRYQSSFQPSPACAGAMTRSGALSLLFDSNLPIADASWDPRAPLGPSELTSSAVLYDSTLRAIPVNVRTWRISERSWEVHVLTREGPDPVERATARVDADDSGLFVAHVEGNLRFSLSLPDGREGPPIDLQLPIPLDQGGSTILSVPGFSWISLSVNGSAAGNCVTP
jgi:hypothetical protein